ncbi:MAG: diadenylate cyclase CdaA [Alphaproteobacteria bacterium]
MLRFLSDSPIIDILDILIVAFLLYRLVLLVRGTRATQMFFGLGLLVIFSWLAEQLGLIVVKQIISSLQTVWVVAFLIIFQPELRTALTHMGRRRGILFFSAPEEIPAQQEIISAVGKLSRRGLGALIVLEREISLGRWAKSGTPLGAEISAELLESIFTMPGPLHDGAVIISQDRITAAACILPNTERAELGYVLGTRHRAAIGLSEVSDAAVIVVSEETRAISLAYGGDIKRGLSIDDLTSELNRIFTSPKKKTRDQSEAQPA